MPSFLWDTKNDFEYCEMTGCKISNDSVVLDDVLQGNVISDVRDITTKRYKFDEIIPNFTAPSGTTCQFYFRSGNVVEPDSTWTDWIEHVPPVERVEYTLSLTAEKIITDYDIKSVVNIYTEYDSRFTIFWSALTDLGTIDAARVDYDSSDVAEYAQDSTSRDNMVVIRNPLPEDNTNVMVEYIPKHVIYDNADRYIQWKCEMTTDDVANSPTLSSVEINYTLKFYREMIDAFPSVFRRL